MSAKPVPEDIRRLADLPIPDGPRHLPEVIAKIIADLARRSPAP